MEETYGSTTMTFLGYLPVILIAIVFVVVAVFLVNHFLQLNK